MQSSKSNKLTSTSLSDSKPVSNQTINDCTSEDEDEDSYKTVSSDPNYYEQHSYDDFFAIMPRFKPVNNWNKDIDERRVIDIFTSSKEQHKKDTKDNFEWVNHKTHPTIEQEIIQACESSFSFIDKPAAAGEA